MRRESEDKPDLAGPFVEHSIFSQATTYLWVMLVGRLLLVLMVAIACRAGNPACAMIMNVEHLAQMQAFSSMMLIATDTLASFCHRVLTNTPLVARNSVGSCGVPGNTNFYQLVAKKASQPLNARRGPSTPATASDFVSCSASHRRF